MRMGLLDQVDAALEALAAVRPTFDDQRARVDGAMHMKVVYVAGKFRGPSAWDIECNIRQAETLALDVWRAGAAALCPHTNTRFFQNAAPDDVWLLGDLALLERCDALITVDNWQDSSGAKAEVEHALAKGLPVFHGLDALRFWLTHDRVKDGLDSLLEA